MNTKLEQIAKKVREAVEQYAPSIVDNVECGDTTDLSCFCAIASHALMTAYRKNGIHASMIIGNYCSNTHCWVAVDEFFIDITITQFDDEKPKVYIVDSYRAKRIEGFEPEDCFRSLKQMEVWESQAPTSKYTNDILKLAGMK